MTPRQASSWLESLAAGDAVHLKWHHGKTYVEQTVNDVSSGVASILTSWGPSWDLDSKPQFTAPGGYVLSTYPLDLGGFAVLSGTSMATPLTAGVYALLAEARGTKDPFELQNVLASTAKPTDWFDEDEIHDFLAPIPQQGAGQIQAFDAANVKTVLSASSISLKDSDHFEADQTFSIKNTGDEDITYTLAHVKTPTVYFFTPGSREPSKFPNPVVQDGPKVTFESDKILVSAGETANVTFSVEPPSHLNETLLPMYGGYIKMSSADGNLQLPFFGVLGSLYDTPVVIPDEVTFFDSENRSEPAPANLTFEMPRPTANSTDDVSARSPGVTIMIKLGTPILRADVVALSDTGLPTTDFFGYKSLGQLPNFPFEWSARSPAMGQFLGKLADGTILPEGSYKFVVSALRVSGDRSKEEDWDIIELPPFNIKYVEA